MAGFAAQGATFTFAGSLGSFTGAITSISVETPTAEVVDMTSPSDPSGYAILVPTGEWSGGGVTVEYIAAAGAGDQQSIVRGIGTLSFGSPKYSVSRRAILESIRQDASVGDLVRGTANFRVTDYAGT